MEISPTPPCPRHELAVNLLPDWSGLVGYVLSSPAASRTLPADHAAVLGATWPRPLRSLWSQPLGSPSVLFRAGGSMPNTVTVATQAVRNGWAVSSAGAQSELSPASWGPAGLQTKQGEDPSESGCRDCLVVLWGSPQSCDAADGAQIPQPRPQGPRHLPPPSDHTLCSGAVGPLEHPRGAPTNPVFQGRTSRLREVERLAQGHAAGPGLQGGTSALRGWAAGSHAPPAGLGSPAALDRGAPPRRPLWQCPARPADPAAPLGLLPLFPMSRSLVPRPWSLVMKLRWD